MAASERLSWPDTPGLPQLTPGDRVHLIGVGGAGMSGLARAMAACHLTVSGCDRSDSEALRRLEDEGVDVHVGHDPRHLDPVPTLVVHSPAVPSDNPELRAAREAGIPVTRRAVLLGSLLDARLGIAIAGTHGKTTVSGLMATILNSAGRSPSFFVGGWIPDLGTDAHMGSGDTLVVEADEYDRSFLHGHPEIAVVTNVEHDHPDIYPRFEDVVDAFGEFVARVRPQGHVIANAASPGVDRVVTRAAAPVDRYYVEDDPLPSSSQDPTWRAAEVRVTRGNQVFRVFRGEDDLGTFELGLPGRHNVGNALAAIAVAEHLGIARETTRRVVAGYRGPVRRFEPLGTCLGVAVVDDYAHHPTEVAATIQAARQRYPDHRLVVVLQPHTYSRLAALADQFVEALRGADHVLLTPVFAAREEPLEGVSSESIAAGVPGAVVAGDLDATARLAAADAEAGDVLVFMGAGDITSASREALRILQERAAEILVKAASESSLGGVVNRKEPLAKHTSLQVGGPADVTVEVSQLDDLAGWWLLARELEVDTRVIGRGTNILVGDGGFRGLVLVNRCQDWQILPEADGNHALLSAESGAALASLSRLLGQQGWSGLEAAVGIPGTVGAAVVVNAGAHGWSIGDGLVSAEVLGPEGSTRIWSADDLSFRYRGSALAGATDHVVLRATLRLSRGDPEAIKELMAGYTAHRRATQPGPRTAGSVFKNPANDYAGRLIEAAGLKGTRSGGAEISPVHANFVVNRSDATAADIHRLIRQARSKVLSMFDVHLELEIEPIGENGVD